MDVQSSSPPRRDARSVNNARGSSSSVGNLELECSYYLFLAYMISRQGFAPPVEDLGTLLLGAIFRTFSHFFAFFSHFGRSVSHHSIFFHFFSIFYRFWMDLGRILGGFWEDFSMFFRFFLKTANFVKYSVLPRKNHYICYVALLKNNEKSTEMRRKSDANLG